MTGRCTKIIRVRAAFSIPRSLCPLFLLVVSRYQRAPSVSVSPQQLTATVPPFWFSRLPRAMQLRPEPVSSGFRIDWIDLIDDDTGVVLWRASHDYAMHDIKYEAVIPKKALDCRAVTRTIGFTSAHRINNLKLRHKEFLMGRCVEEWESEFGIVLANLNETWETTFIPKRGITSSSANIISGNLLVETSFFDGDKLITTINILMFYE